MTLGPVVFGLFRTFQCIETLEAGRHRCIGSGQNLMMLDVQRAQPALLAHRDGDEIADLDQLRLAEVLVQAVPQLVVGRQIPGDRFGVSQRGLLALVVSRRSFRS